jgi:hypothetical protein
LKKFTVKDHFEKWSKLRGCNSVEDKCEIESLMVNWGSICINPKLRTKIKKTLKFKVGIEVQ